MWCTFSFVHATYFLFLIDISISTYILYIKLKSVDCCNDRFIASSQSTSRRVMFILLMSTHSEIELLQKSFLRSMILHKYWFELSPLHIKFIDDMYVPTICWVIVKIGINRNYSTVMRNKLARRYPSEEGDTTSVVYTLHMDMRIQVRYRSEIDLCRN